MRLRGVDGGTYLGLLLLLETEDDGGFCDSVTLLRFRCEYWRRTGGVSGEEATTRAETEIPSRRTRQLAALALNILVCRRISQQR